MPSARPGQPANPVSLGTHQQPASAQPANEGTAKAAPGPSYESDDEDGQRGTVQERLGEVTRSVKGHANAAGAGALDDAAQHQVEGAAQRLPEERGGEPQVQVGLWCAGARGTWVDVRFCVLRHADCTAGTFRTVFAAVAYLRRLARCPLTKTQLLH